MMREMKVCCRLCGKELSDYCYNFGNYAYKIDGKYYCSWSCYRKALKEKDMAEIDFLKRSINILENNVKYIIKKAEKIKSTDKGIENINTDFADAVVSTNNIIEKIKKWERNL